MKFKTISILLPTRGRVQQLDQTIKSVRRKADQPPRVEMVFRCDIDDLDTQEYLRANSETYIVGPREMGYASLPKFMNQCAALSKGDVIIMMNDDAIMETQGWDTKILKCANLYPDGIFNIGVRTGLNDNLVPFSIVSRYFYNTLGYINDERLIFSDIFILDIMEILGRVVRLPEVTIKHYWSGHDTDDLTRLDAQIHENTIVFDGTPGTALNPKKNWRKTYLSKHDEAVREAIKKFNSKADGFVSSDTNHIQIMSECDPTVVEPPACYEADQLKSMLHGRCLLKKQNAIVVPVNHSINNDLFWPDIHYWSRIFFSVYGIVNRPNDELHNFIPFGNARIYSGLLDDARTRCRLRDICAGSNTVMYGKFNVLIVNDGNYNLSVATYFIFKRVLTNSPIAIFIHNKHSNAVNSNDRFIRELAEGYFDAKKHKFEIYRNSNGAGFTLEYL